MNPVIKEEGFSSNTFFIVMGKDNNGEFKVERKFSDFDKLRSILISRFSGVYVPTLPSKKLIGGGDQ